jgi:CRISPR-associated protein Cas5d
MKPYPIQLEISGPTALWTRPDTGSSPVSYVAPTFSAVKGIFESVLRWKSVNVRPTKLNPLRLDRGEGRVRCRVQRCAPVQFHRYTTNYGGPLRASDAMNKGASYSLARRTGEGGRRPGEGGRFTVVLVNVCYRPYAQAEFAGHHDGTTWPPHAYHDVFNRALDRGQWFYTPCLGCDPSPALCAGEGGRRPGEGRRWHNRKINSSSAAPDYVGPPAVPKPLPGGEGWFRPETRVCEIENHELPTMLRMVFDSTAILSQN